jgi:crotonobetainyl-CoA:carnitine CoA-transferase CaiB-like acyl-CoA transferase
MMAVRAGRVNTEAAELQAVRGPLTGVRVVDLTSVFLGPYCTQILGDMGADVIKVESPVGDIVRGIGPARNAGMGPIHLNVNRSKRSLVLDLRQAAARTAVLKLVETADVFVHNMRPHAIARLGLTYEKVSAARPDIVYCVACGFGQDGPYAGKPAYEDIVQGAAGLAAVQGQAQPEPGYVKTAIVDKTCGLVAAYAIAMALYHRERTGEGQAIEVPMFETMVSFVLMEQLYGMTFEPAMGGATYPRLVSCDRRPYRTTDGYICVLVYTDRHWAKLFELVGRSDLTADDRFRTIAARTDNTDELYAFLARLLEQRSTREWLELFEQADIPAMPLNSVEDLLHDPHLAERDFIRNVTHHSEGEIRTVGIPVKFSRTPGRIERLAPRLGEQSRELLAEAGFSAAEIDALIEADVTIGPGSEDGAG